MLDDLGVTSINEDDVAEELDDTDDQQRHSPLSISSTDSSEYKKTVNDSANQSNVEPNKTTIFIETLGIGRRGTQTFALYNVRVTKTDANGRSIASWNTIRRYSDFHTLHGIIINRFVNLRTLSFPGKKTFKNLDQAFLEKRRKALEAYMNVCSICLCCLFTKRFFYFSVYCSHRLFAQIQV
jgi:hypothetical protein